MSWLEFWGRLYNLALSLLTQPPGGPGIIATVPSLYSVEEERMANVNRLRELCDQAVSNPAFAPRDGKTYCNFAARFICEGMGFFGIPYTAMANDIIAILAISPGWREDSIERAHAHAMKGGLALLVLEDEPHGHVPVIYPAPMEMSGSWGEEVPMLANVGTTNGVMKASMVYRVEHRPRLRAFLFGEAA